MTKGLSQAVEARLMAAIEKTAALVTGGAEPNDAIVKAASEEGISPGHVHLLVHAYNTGRTTRQRQEGRDIFEKAASFALADTATVLEQLYATNVKTAAVREMETAVSAAYAMPPSSVIARRHLREKQAAVVDWNMGGPPSPLPTDPKHRLKQAYCEADRITRQIEEARRVKSAAWDKLANTFNDLTDYFKSPTSIPIPVVRENAMILHGDSATHLLDQIVAVTPSLLKMSQHRQRPPGLHAAIGEPYALIMQFADDLDHFKQASASHEKIASDGQERQEALLRPFVQYAGPQSVLDEPISSTKLAFGQGIGKAVDTLAKGSFAMNLWDRVAGGLKDPDNNSLVQKQMDQLNDPNHEARLGRIRAQATLQDLSLNDPVISGYQPAEVSQAFNDIVEVSPRAATQRMLLQALLRQRLEQGTTDPMTVDVALGAENKMRDRDLAGNYALAGPPKTGGRRGSVLDDD